MSWMINAICLSLLALCLSAIWFYCYSIYAAASFFREAEQFDLNFRPPITILKPIRGLDGDAYENMASFCKQNYPKYEIIFGAMDERDDGVQVVRQVMENFPDLDIKLVISNRTIGTNLKVSNLANMMAEARYPLLLISDSDISVEPDYLSRVVQPMRDERVGVVTCLYRSLAHNWIATLEAIAIPTEFFAGVLTARKMEGMKFTLGSTVLIKRSVLEAIGGFQRIADYLADDFLLGNLSAQAGYQVVLSHCIVNHTFDTKSFRDLLRHQVRWSRGTRVCRPRGYLGLITTYGTFTSLLFLLASGGSSAGWAALAVTWIARLAMGWIIGINYLNDPVAKRAFWLVPIRDLLTFAIWCCGLVGNKVEWRGQKFRLTKDGKLLPIEPGQSQI
jgi:ceramide glucosyltransferase